MSRRVVHISDLHFGRDDAALIDPLYRAIEQARPDVVAVSGDVTQRARTEQFRAAREFLDRLPAPWICVPGNHDIPLYNPLLRMVLPYRGYRKHISRELNPCFETEGLIIQGINTADRFAWQRGKLRAGQLARACERFDAARGARIIMAHHPFEQSPESHKQLMPNASEALDKLVDCGTDIILSGHLHRWRAEPFLARKGDGRILQVHVGTGLSTRRRGQDNDFAILDIEGKRCHLRRMIARDNRFVEASRAGFDLNPT